MITTTLESAPRITDALASVPDLRDVLSPEAVIEHVIGVEAPAGWELLASGADVTVVDVDADNASISAEVEAPARHGDVKRFRVSIARQFRLDMSIGGRSNIIVTRCWCWGPLFRPPARCKHVAAVAFHLLGYPYRTSSPPCASTGEGVLVLTGRFEEYVDAVLAASAAPTAPVDWPQTAAVYDSSILTSASTLEQVVSVPKFTAFTDLVRLDAFLALARLVAEYEPNVTRRFGETPGHGKTMSRLAAIYDSAVNHVEDIYARATEGLPFDELSELQALMAERNVRVMMAFSQFDDLRSMTCNWFSTLDYVADKARPHLEAYAAFRHPMWDRHRTAKFQIVSAEASSRRADAAAVLLAVM